MTEQQKAKQALRTWAAANQIGPVEFHRQTGFTYQHAWNILRGNRPITEKTLGRLLIVWPEAAQIVAQAFTVESVG